MQIRWLMILFVAMVAPLGIHAQPLQQPGATNRTDKTEVTNIETNSAASSTLVVAPEATLRTNQFRVQQSRKIEFRGLIPSLSSRRNPLQMVNPFAPPEYGDGFRNVSFDPRSGRSEGISVFAVHY